MSAFRYRLELPLRLARVRMTQARRELGQLLRRRAEIEAEIAATQRRILDLGNEILARSRDGISGAELTRLTLERDQTVNRLPGLDETLQQQLSAEQEVQERLQAATKELKVLEKQRREKKVLYLRDRGRREQAGVDDVVLVRRAGEMAWKRRVEE